jgi:hypothetical protein
MAQQPRRQPFKAIFLVYNKPVNGNLNTAYIRTEAKKYLAYKKFFSF